MAVQVKVESIVDLKQEEDSICDPDRHDNITIESESCTQAEDYIEEDTQVKIPIKCDICFMTFTGRANLRSHRKTHLRVSNIKCQHCPKTFSSKKALSLHLVGVHKKKNPNVKTYTCELCGKEFVSLLRLQLHVSDLHVVDKSAECSVCHRMFADEDVLAFHVKINHKKRKIYTCDVCSKKYTHKEHLVRHLGVNHGRFFDCSKCSRSYGTKTDFDQHSTLVSDSPDSELQCHICHVFLPSHCSFNIHTKSHAKQEESKRDDVKIKEEKSPAKSKWPQDSMLKKTVFKCDWCVETFDQSLSLTLHKKKVHQCTKWQCESCPKTFDTTTRLRDHEQTHVLVRPWECNVCGKTFKRKWQLGTHERTHDHDSVKKYKCLHCPKSFTHPNKLRRHMGHRHGGERPFKCDQCDKSWVTKFCLERHLLSIHHRSADLPTTPGQTFSHIRREILNSKEGSLVFVCNLCNFKFKDEKEVALHNMKHGLPKLILSEAVLCAKHNPSGVPSIVKMESTDLSTSIGSNSNLALVKTEQGSETLSCSLCCPVKSLSPNSGSSGAIKPRFECQHCCKSFSRKSALNRHLELHANENANRCSSCEKQLSSSQSLQRHMKICGL